MAVKPMGLADASRLVRETQARKKPLRYEDRSGWKDLSAGDD